MIELDVSLNVLSLINKGDVIFADGIERDFLSCDWGTQVNLRVAEARLRLVVE